MKSIKSIIFVLLILCAFVTPNSRFHKNKRTTSKSKVKTATKVFDWSIKDDNTFTVYIYVNSQDVFSTATFNTYSVCPSNTSKTKGWNFNVSSNKGLFSKIAEAINPKHFVDFKNCSTFIGNPSYSLWGSKGKTVSAYCRSNDGQDYKFTVMFQYSLTSNYITTNDLSTLTTSLNEIRNARNSEIIGLKKKCNIATSNYSSYEASVINLSKPNTEMDDSIASAKKQKKEFDENFNKFEAEVDSRSNLISKLQQELAEASNNLSIAQQKDAYIESQKLLKDSEILELTASKNSAQKDRDGLLQKAKAEVEAVKSKFKVASDQLKTACVECQAAVSLASAKFNTTPYDPAPVILAINSITISG